MLQGPTDLLAWVTIGLFVAGLLARRRDDRTGRVILAGAWLVFAAFWAVLVPHFALAKQSIIEGVLAALAVPLCAYVGYALRRDWDVLFVLSKAVAVMGLVYLPAATLPVVSEFLIETVTRQTEWVMNAFGYSPEVRTTDGLRNRFVFSTGAGSFSTHIVFACTGIGSMTIMIGLAAAVDAPLRRKVRALAVALPVIWVLNIARNVFIALAHGHQWFPYFEAQVRFLFGESNPELVSYLIADRVISQSLSVVALIAILWIMMRELPELRDLVNDVLYLLTGTDYELGGGRRPPRGGVRADGSGERDA